MTLPILFSNECWLLLAVPESTVPLYRTYMRRCKDLGDPWESPRFNNLYTREQVFTKAKQVNDSKRVDRLTALLKYGFITE